MQTHNRDDPRGNAANKGNYGRLCRRVVSFHYRVECAAEVIFSGLQSVKAVSKPWGREREHSIRVRVPIQRSGGKDLTCKSDDVQRYAIHGGENIGRHAIGWTVMDLRLPEFTHLLASNKSGTRR